MKLPERPGRAVLLRALDGVGALYRSVGYRRAREMPEGDHRRSTLVLAPHADDETLGCGALIARRCAAGARVDVVIASDGGASHPPSQIEREELVALRRGEASAACAALGVAPERVHFLELPDGELGRAREALTGEVARLLGELQPADVFVASLLDHHDDHQALALATRAAVAGASPRARLYEYPVWYWERPPWTRRPRSAGARMRMLLRDPVAELLRTGREQVRTGAFLAMKREALGAYRSQIAHRDGDPNWYVLPERLLGAMTGPAEIFYRVRA